MGNIDEKIENLVREDNPQAEAVKSLINVQERIKGKRTTDVEIKTDLSEDQIRIHSVLQALSHIIEMDAEEFNETCVLGNVIELIERKSISKNRLGRGEVVNVARNPDTNIGESDMRQSVLKRFFTPHPKLEQR